MTDQAEDPKPKKDVKSKPPLLDQLVQNSVALYAGLILLGYVHLQSFYGVFRIQVWTFLQVTDIMLSFVAMAWITVFYALQMGVIYGLRPSPKRPDVVEFILRSIMPVEGDEAERKRIRKQNAWVWAKDIVAALLMVGWVIWAGLVIIGIAWGTWNILVIGMGPGMIVLALMVFTPHRMAARKAKPRRLFFSLSAFLVLVLTMIVGAYSGHQITRYGPTAKAVIYTDTDTIRTNDTLFYLDKLSGYVFLWNKRDSVVTTLMMSDIRRLDLSPQQRDN